MSNKMSYKRLIPCPFCGMTVMAIRNRGGVLPFSVECGRYECNAMTKYFPTEAEAIAAWNTRKPMEQIVERLENASYMTECTFDEDGWSNNDNYEVVLLDKAIEIVKEEMGYGILRQTDSL